MIETYKILNGIYDKTVMPNIPVSLESHTRGNSLKIVNCCCHYDLRKYSFCNRITNVWNSLLEDIVTAPSVNSFKNRLVKHWFTQKLKYNTVVLKYIYRIVRCVCELSRWQIIKGQNILVAKHLGVEASKWRIVQGAKHSGANWQSGETSVNRTSVAFLLLLEGNSENNYKNTLNVESLQNVNIVR